MARGNWQRRAEIANERKTSNHQRKNRSNQLQALLNQYGTNNHDVLIFQSSITTTDTSRYCKSFFFRGECRSRKKCRFAHDISLLDSLKVNNDDINMNVVALCEEAAEKEQAELSLVCIRYDNNNNKALIDCEALVYIIADGKIAYDLYRGGVLKQQQQKADATNNKSPRESKVSNNNSKEKDNNNNNDRDEKEFSDSVLVPIQQKLRYSQADGENRSVKLATGIPIVILEHISLFLPDYYIGVLTQVCKSWQCFGDSSSITWKRLLEDRNWKEAKNNIETKSLFIANYCAMRNMLAIQKGIQILLDPKDRDSRFPPLNSSSCGTFFVEIGDSTTAGCAVQIFKSTLGSPSTNDICVSMSMSRNKVWDTTNYDADLVRHSIFSAYHMDGTIRIFEPVADTRGKGALCRQTACVRSILRSKGINLTMMEMDDTYILCIANSSNDGIIFTVLRKDEVVCDSGGVGDNGAIDSNLFKVYHANDLVSEHVVSSVSYVNEKSLLPCGKGLFFLQLSITLDCDYSQEQDMLCVFSARQGAILFFKPRPLPDRISVYSRRSQQSSCSIIQKNDGNFTIYHITQEEDTQMKNLFSISALTAGSSGHDNSLEYSTIEMIHCEQRSIRSSQLLRFTTGFVEVVKLEEEEEIQTNEVKVQQFTRSHSVADFSDPFTLHIEGNIVCVDQISDDHIVIVSELTDAVEPLNPYFSYAYVVHLLTHQVINKVYFGMRYATRDPCRYSFAYSQNHDFLACQVGCEAMILSGREVRQIYKIQYIGQQQIVSPESDTKKKKKNKRQASKNGKKDGFARGMNMRG